MIIFFRVVTVVTVVLTSAAVSGFNVKVVLYVK